MNAVQDSKIFLNNALRPTHLPIELDAEAPLPDTIKDMPDQVTGQFVGLEPSANQEIATAWKRVMIFNATEVLYTFTFDAAAARFSARKR
jgi:hypothetical protein